MQCDTVLEKPDYKTTKKQKCKTMKGLCKSEDKFMKQIRKFEIPSIKTN
jgi:hypothetical protein